MLRNLMAIFDFNIHLLAHSWLQVMIVVALVCFIVSELTRNYSQVDKLWSLMPIVYGWMTFASFPSARIFIMASLVTIWGLRLSYNFSRKGGYSIIPWRGEEDYRWQVMRDNPLLKGRIRFGIFNLLFISFYQNILIFLFSTPLLLAAQFSDKPLTVTDLIAATLMLGFIITETVADNQRFRFHKEKASGDIEKCRYRESVQKGFICEGLWKYSRHPNFASEQAIWISFYIFGVAASGQVINITIIGSILLVLLFIGSTILTEKISSEKYPEYLTYMKEIPKFIPSVSNLWAKKRKDN